jgi:uncharacterized membrane protein YhaH (DUF805 family)/ribosomal protein L40E
VNWYLAVLKKYAVFAGRARRKEYWRFLGFNLLIVVVLAVIGGTIGTSRAHTGVGLLSGIYAAAVLIPGLAVSVRRLHDTNRSGWWLLVVLIPLVGAIVLLVLYAQDGQPGENQYGPSPKMGQSAAAIGTAQSPLITSNAASILPAEAPAQLDASASPVMPSTYESRSGVAPQLQSEEAVTAPMTFCTNCGTSNPADAKFCRRCGSLLFRSGKASMEDLPTPPMPRPPTSSSPAVERAASNSSGMATDANAPQRWSLAATAALLTALFGILLSGCVSYRVGMKHGFRRGLDQEKSLLTIDEPVLGPLKNGLPTVVGSQPVNAIREIATTNYWAGLAHGEEAGWDNGFHCFELHHCGDFPSPALTLDGLLSGFKGNQNTYSVALRVADATTMEQREKLMKQLRGRGLLGQN